MKKPSERERGFALLIVVLLVALLALTGAALLDLVSVDITLSGEHQKIVRAQLLADGGLREVLADVNSQARLPEFDYCASNVPSVGCPNYRYNWASLTGGVYMKDPDNVFGIRAPLDESNSALAKFTAAPRSQENYEATIDIVRVVEVPDTSLTVTRAVVYEVNTSASVAGGDVYRAVSAEIYKKSSAQPGSLLPTQHFR